MRRGKRNLFLEAILKLRAEFLDYLVRHGLDYNSQIGTTNVWQNKCEENVTIVPRTTSDKNNVNKKPPKPPGDAKIFPRTAPLHRWPWVVGHDEISWAANTRTTNKQWPSVSGTAWLCQTRPENNGREGKTCSQSFVKRCGVFDSFGFRWLFLGRRGPKGILSAPRGGSKELKDAMNHEIFKARLFKQLLLYRLMLSFRAGPHRTVGYVAQAVCWSVRTFWKKRHLVSNV